MNTFANGRPFARGIVTAQAAATLLVFLLGVGGTALLLRNDVRARLLEREAEALRSTAALQYDLLAEDWGADLLEIDPEGALFEVALRASKLRGVLALRVYDGDGTALDGLPATAPEDDLDADTLLLLAEGRTAARYEPDTDVAALLSLRPARDLRSRPVLTVTAPLGDSGAVRFWVEGEALGREIAALDRRIALQAALIAGLGMLAAALGATWARRQIQSLHTVALARTAEAAAATREASFTARTAALGAVTAHLLHAIKNPLASLDRYVAMTDAPLKPDAEDAVRRIRAAVDETLLVLREEGAARDFTLSWPEFLEVLRSRVLPVARAHGVELSIAGAPDGSLAGRRASLLLLAGFNLVENACEASEPGAAVRVRAERAGDTVVLRIDDAAGGLPGAVRARLFEPVPSGKPAGTGLGLVITRQLARSADAEVHVEDLPGGTSFRIHIPDSRCTPSASSSPPRGSPSPSTPAPRPTAASSRAST